MIHRERPAAPASLEAAGKTELALASVHYKKNKSDPFPFKAYKDEATGELLNALFHKKCAYCESRYKAVHPMEAEHYRPKGRISLPGPPKRFVRGYWWLAASWDNLLPACIFCNRLDTHTHMGDVQGVSGKADFFPLFNESARASAVGEEINEEPLLLNPCDIDPQDLIQFKVEGKRAYIHPLNPDSASSDWQRVTETVRILGLNRTDLAEERCERMIKAQGAARRAIRLGRIAQDTSDLFHKAELLEEAESAMAEVIEYTSAEAPYAAAARAAVIPELRAAGLVPHWSAKMKPGLP